MKTNPAEKKLIIDLTSKFMEGAKGWPRKLGRYSCSSLHSMLEGSKLPWGLPVNKYFDIEDISFESAMRMNKGTRAHEFIQKFLDPTRCERKFEYHYYGFQDPRNGTKCFVDEEGNRVEPIFILVGKIDYLPDDSAWEIKSSEQTFTSAKDYHIYQAKLYCNLADRPKAYLLQPLELPDRLILAQVGDVIPRDDEWFEGEMVKLHSYHDRLALFMKERERLSETKSSEPEYANV